MQYGRTKVYTDQPIITKENIIDVLRKGYSNYEANFADIKYLLDYEKGKQEISRVKTYRKDIDNKCVDNLANEITEFKTSFIWGNPITFVQRGK